METNKFLKSKKFRLFKKELNFVICEVNILSYYGYLIQKKE